jgi:mannitol/fructose-specific phosphotransferase system IIA component (Ntr-type)
MQLQEIFGPGDVLLDLPAHDKWEAIAALVAHLAVSGGIPEEREKELLESVLERERSMSTGMERGLAIPHAAVEGIEQLGAVLGVVRDPKGLDFESIDGEVTRLVVLLLIPRAQKLLHIRTLADIARGLGSPELREALVLAGDPSEAWDVMGSPAKS